MRCGRATATAIGQPIFALNERIHLAIAKASGNPTLERMQRSLDGRVRSGRYQANMDHARWDQAMAEHEQIADALRTRDSGRLGDLLRHHLENKLNSLRVSIDRDGHTCSAPE